MPSKNFKSASDPKQCLALHATEQGVLSTIDLVKKNHGERTDSNGQLYYMHLLRVAENVYEIYPEASDDVIRAALLHDEIEDELSSPEELKKLGYSDRCIELINLVSRPKNDRRPYAEYISDLIASGDKEAMLIKIADNIDNLNPRRLAEVAATDPQRAKRLENKYRASIQRLCEELPIDMGLCQSILEKSPQIGDNQNGVIYYDFDNAPVRTLWNHGVLMETYSLDDKTGQLIRKDILSIHIERDASAEDEITEEIFNELIANYSRKAPENKPEYG